MRVEYLINVRLSTGKLFKAVEDVETSLNSTMKGFGFDEKIVITSVLPVSLSVSRALTSEEIDSYTKVVERTFAEKYGFAQVESFKLIPQQTKE